MQDNIMQALAQPLDATLIEYRKVGGRSQPVPYLEGEGSMKELRSGKTVVDRFWAKVNKDGPVPQHCPDLGPCWLWAAHTTARGYGTISRGGSGKHNRAHRVGYELQVGPIPEGHDVLHRCDNPTCVRGEHLFTGTHAENMADMAAKGRAATGERFSQSKLTAVEVMAIRETYTAGSITMRALAITYGVDHTVIWEIIHRKKWKHI